MVLWLAQFLFGEYKRVKGVQMIIILCQSLVPLFDFSEILSHVGATKQQEILSPYLFSPMELIKQERLVFVVTEWHHCHTASLIPQQNQQEHESDNYD